VTTGENAAVIARLFEAYTEGRTDDAVQLLAEDVVFYADPSRARIEGPPLASWSRTSSPLRGG
jgi:hypothetical protein